MFCSRQRPFLVEVTIQIDPQNGRMITKADLQPQGEGGIAASQ